MYGAFGTWQNVEVDYTPEAGSLPNTVENFLEVSSRDAQNSDTQVDGVEYGLHSSYNADEGIEEYFPYWLEWGEDTEEYHALSGVGGGTPNTRLHSYMVLSNGNGEWDLLYDFNTVGTTRLQEGAQLTQIYATTAVVYPNTFTLLQPFENRVQVLDGNDQWRKPYLGETSRSEPKTCGALPHMNDPLWEELNLPPWCVTTSQGTVQVPNFPTQVDYFRVDKRNTTTARAAGPAGTPRTVDPAARVANDVDQAALQACLDKDPYGCLTTVPGLRACVAKRLACNAGTVPDAVGGRTKRISAQQALSMAGQRTKARLGDRSASLLTDAKVRTVSTDGLPQPLTRHLGPAAGRTVHLVTGEGTVPGLRNTGSRQYTGYTFVYDAGTGALIYSCLGRNCP
ncbi:hypothetical protein AB0H83_25340 [Dactylosporangium sp. NPDC050688]|uniref:hypothetical protein n=1 Tax=Dactylosporangium sp. NPDC050688 TaxID=3157217 RepID=UPI0033D43905